MASVVEFDVPDFSYSFDIALEESIRDGLINIQAFAKETAPVDTGFYRNSILIDLDGNQVVANANYSAPIEYGVGGTRRNPNPIMRNAGIKETQVFPEDFVRNFERAL